MTKKKIAIIGVGNVGASLGYRLSQSDFPVRFGVREGKDISDLLAECGKGSESASPADAARWADIVFLAVPGNAAVELAKSLATELEGTILVDCNNLLAWDGGPVWTPPEEGSLTAAMAAAVPGARVVKGFNTFGSEFHRDPNIHGVAVDVPLAGDDADAKSELSAVAEAAGFHAIDAGPLRNAALLENMAVLWIHLALVGGQGREAAFKLMHRDVPAGT